MIEKIVKSHYFYKFVLTSIVLNSIIIGIDLSLPTESHYHSSLIFYDKIVSYLFLFELVLRIYTYRLAFFKSGWNIFDFIIIVSSSLILESEIFFVFRAFRIVEVLRLISIIPKMRMVSQALFKTLPSMLGICILLLNLYYVYAIIVTYLYGKDFPHWFGSIGDSFYTLFQIMTFESWSMGIVRPVMEVHPHAWIIFVSFLLIASYIILNIAIGVIVDCVGEIRVKEEKDEEAVLLNKMQSLEQEIIELKQLLKIKITNDKTWRTFLRKMC